MKKILATCAVAWGLAAAPASAATLVTDTDGKLVGATGVEVDGYTYDVEFLDGIANDIFSGGSQLASLPIEFADFQAIIRQSYAIAEIVAQAGLSSKPSKITGCESALYCSIYLPVLFDMDNDQVPAYATVVTSRNTSAAQITYFNTLFDTRSRAEGTFARFSNPEAISTPPLLTPAVPEPASWLMLLIGFFSIGGILRRGATPERAAFSLS